VARAAYLTTAAEAAERDWPRTSRVLPWLVAGVMAMLFVVPIDSMTLPGPLPFDPRPDRYLLIGCFVTLILAVAVGARVGSRRTPYRFGAVDVLIALFVVAAIASVALNLPVLSRLNEAAVASKKLMLLVSYVTLYFFVVVTVRPSEVLAFVRLLVGLGVIAALGTIVEYWSGLNIFFLGADVLSPPGARVAPDSGVVIPGGRPDVTGPARHGLAICAMLAMTLPVALVGCIFGTQRRVRLLYGLAALAIFVGGLTTFRRAGVVLPFVAVSVLVMFGGRRMLPILAVTVVAIAAIPLVAPDAVRELAAQFSATNISAQQSIEARTADYPAVVPDLRAGALIGRGFGSYDANRYRFLDNQYIALVIETGFVGLACYVALLLAAGGLALRMGLARRGVHSWIALAAAGSILAYAVANALFDALAFPHAPYALMLITALMSVSRRALDHGAE